MSQIIGVIIVVGIIGAILWFARKAGTDSAQNGAAQDALKDINDALRPITDDELKRVRDKYKRP